MTITRRTFLKSTGALVGGLAVDRSIAQAGLDSPALSVPNRTEKAYQVALARAESYERDTIRDKVFTLIDQLGGLGDVVRSGDRVAIKTNLTGGTWVDDTLDQPSTELHITHPEVTRALVEAVLDAGASEVFIVEAIYDPGSWTQWGNAAIAEDFEQVKLINLNDPEPYDDFETVKVRNDWLVYDSFKMHPILHDVDAFMSIAKMKCHATAGITLSMKNIFGILPMASYRLSEKDTYRSELHGYGSQAMIRVPSIIMDLVRTRPIDFALIDGVKTCEGSEGPWTNDFNAKAANTLVAGKNMVATDAVAAAVMGFDPAAASFAQEPFLHCLNHIQLASTLGLGSNNLDEIEIVGEVLEDLRTSFRPYGVSY